MVLIVNTSERTGGAAIAANRLMKALNKNGIDAKMLVLHKTSDDPCVSVIGKSWQKKWKFYRERIFIWLNNLFSKKNLFTVSIADSGFDITKHPDFINADLIHLHWINQGFLSLESLRCIFLSNKPVIWTMHDMWECTGICHYAYTCNNYTKECRNCLFLRFPGKHDLANRIFLKKQQLWQNSSFSVVTVSNWLAERARTSRLLADKPIYVIPNTISISEFVPQDKNICRKELQLPATPTKILLFGAYRIDTPIKGFDKLLQALEYLIKNQKILPQQLHLVLFGGIKHPEQIFKSIPITYTYKGTINENSLLAKLYSAADILISASSYETFGQTLIEAQACGCLPVSYNNSGQTDIIRHKETGYLAEYPSIESLADGILWGITEGKKISSETLRQNVINHYTPEIVAKQYEQLYRNKLNLT
ncbi:MAG: glycosyltransferase [Lentimicrobiaceae bacterium]|nr:glycosyltransferase [Lentimicrobiaceae bacterium]